MSTFVQKARAASVQYDERDIDSLISSSLAVDRHTLAALEAFFPNTKVYDSQRRVVALNSLTHKLDDVNSVELARGGFTLVREIQRKKFISKGKTPTSKLKDKSRFKMLLDDYPAIDWKPYFHPSSTFDESDANDVFLHPWKKTDFSATDWIRVMRRVKTETKPGGIANLPIMLHIVRCSIKRGFNNLDNVPLKFLKTYIDMHGDSEPLIMGKNGNEVSEVHLDSVAAIRILTCLQAAIFYDDYEGVFTDAWWYEVMKMMLDDPYYNVAKYKTGSTLALQAAFSLTPLGSPCVRYLPVNHSEPYPSYEGHTLGVVDRNDHVFYAVMRDDIQKELTELSKDAPITANLIASLIDKPVTAATMRQFVLLRSVVFWQGYGRGQTHIAHYNQFYIETPAEEARPGEHPWATAIKSEFLKMFRWSVEHNKIPNWFEFRRTFPYALKTTASGMEPVKIDVKLPRQYAGIRGLSDHASSDAPSERDEGSGWLSIKSQDKKMVGLFMPDECFDHARMMEKHGMDNPGAIGVREVTGGGKPPRGINVIPLPEFNLSRVFGDAMNDFVNKEDPALGYEPFATSNDFVAGKEVGNTYVDGFPMALATAPPPGTVMFSIAADYKNYDTTQKHQNSRVYQLAALEIAIAEAGMTDVFGPIPGGIPEAVRRLFGDGIANNAVALSGRVPPDFFEAYFPGIDPNSVSVDDANKVLIREKIKARYILVTSLRSGELITLASNSLNNRANFRTWLDYEYPDYMTLLHMRIQGDDSLQVWRLAEGQDITKARYERLVETFTKITSENGLIIKKQKFVARMFSMEFLQRWFIYGIYAPKPVIQPFATEKVSRGETAISMMRSYAGKMNALVSRGISPRLATNLTTFMWSWKRSMTDKSDYKFDQTYYMPYSGLHVPVADGGVGRLWFTTVGANVDTVICDISRQFGEIDQNLFESAIAIISVKAPTTRREIAHKINSDSRDVKPHDPFKRGRDFIRSTMFQDRVEQSMQSDAYLMNNHIAKVGQYSYAKYPEVFVEDSISSDKQLRMIDYLDKASSVKQMRIVAQQRRRKPFNASYSWIREFSFIDGDEIPYKYDKSLSPASGFADAFQEVAARYGLVRGREMFKIRASRLLSILKEDKYFRRDLRDESIIQILSSPRVMNNVDNIAQVLIAVGARPDLAERVAAEFKTRSAAFIFKSSVSGISMADPLLSWLDLSLEAHYAVVSVDLLPNVDLVDLLMLHGMARSVLLSFRYGTSRLVRCAPNSNQSAYNALKIIQGPSTYDAFKWITFYKTGR